MQMKADVGCGVPAAAGRVLSLDIFRGLTMLVMIFVNDLSGVRGLPWWTYHMPSGVNGMTYVDVVFPAFLFILGMAIPLAVRKRLAMGDSMPRLGPHPPPYGQPGGARNCDRERRQSGPASHRSQFGTLGRIGADRRDALWTVYPRTGDRQLLSKTRRSTRD